MRNISKKDLPMKTALKFLAAAACMSLMTANAQASDNIHSLQNCKMIVSVEKVQPQNPGETVSWNVTVSYKTPGMRVPVQGATLTGFSEEEVNPFAINSSKRICYIANDPNRYDDPCPETDFLIVDGLEGYGNTVCDTFPGHTL
jgi:hypothetical protein